jgi:hypothetical protein
MLPIFTAQLLLDKFHAFSPRGPSGRACNGAMQVQPFLEMQHMQKAKEQCAAKGCLHGSLHHEGRMAVQLHM